MSPFDFVNAINQTKEKFQDYSEYSPFLTNKTLSFFPDTILMANLMNMNSHLDNKLQFEFFLNTVRKQKRFAGKWPKHEVSDIIKLLCSTYNMSSSKAHQAVAALTQEQIEQIKTRIIKGG